MMREAPDGQPGGDDAPSVTRGTRGHHTAGHRNTTISMDVRADWSEAFALVPSLQVGYIWYASVHTLEVMQGLLGIGFELASQIIWDKGSLLSRPLLVRSGRPLAFAASQRGGGG